jgi:nucleotide-binding universal stress UspA family protein
MTNHIRRILIPIDFSACSRAAFERALDLAEALHAKVDLLYVSHDLLPGGPFTAKMALGAQVRGNARLALERFAKDFGERAGNVDRLITNGDSTDVIGELGEDGRYDLIVMGTHGRRGPSRVLIGSVAEDVLRRVSCPVLLVKAPPRESALARIARDVSVLGIAPTSPMSRH